MRRVIMNILMMTSAAPLTAPFSTGEKRVPLGVGSLITVLKKAGHNVFFVDNYLAPSNILDSNFLKKNSIDFVGIYANTICYQSTLSMFNKLQKMRESREWSGKIMVGGPHTSVALNTIPEFVDHVVIGEGEITILEIIEGVVTDRVIQGKPVVDMDSLPFPAWEDFIHKPYTWTDHWADTAPVYTLNTSRGCPFGCTFCSVKSIWGQTYRCMSAQRVLNDVEFMIKYYGMKVAYFREDHFTLNKKRIIEFCELLLKKKINIDWMCETRVDSLDDFGYQKLMARAGCKVFYIGVESGSQKMLDFYKKGENVEQFVKAFEIARKVGIKTYGSFIFGAPTETESDRHKTEDLILRIKPDYIGRNVFVGIPGSELYDYTRNNNLYEYEDLNRVLYLKGHNKLVDLYYNGNPYMKVPNSSQKRQVFLYEMQHFIGHACNSLRKVWGGVRSV